MNVATAGPALRRPPGPNRSQPLQEIRSDPLGFLDGMLRDHGELSFHEAGGGPVFVASSPRLARTILRERYNTYVKSGTPDEQMLRPLLGNGLLTSEGADWERQRKLCAPAFRPATIEQFTPLVSAAARTMSDRWASTPGDVRVDHELMSLTLAVIAQAMLGTDLTEMGPGFGRAVDAVNRYLGHVVPGQEPGPGDLRLQVGFDQGRALLELIVRTLVSARQLGGEGEVPDLLSALIAAGVSSAPAGAPGAWQDTELRDQVITMVMAGHETTAKALTWALHLLGQNPTAAATARREVDEVLAGRAPVASDLARLPTVRAVLLESMRLYPPVWLISRRAVHDDELDGYPVEAGALVCISPWVLHRLPEVWEAPEAFRPERFADGEAEQAAAHAYLPFGGGPRTCIGQHFAILEATVVLATLLQRLELGETPGQQVVPEALVTLRPRDGLLMTASARP